MAVMTFDVSISTISPSLDDSTDSETYSTTASSSSNEIYIGNSSRRQLPPILSSDAISKSLPQRLAGGVVTRGLRPPRSKSAYRHSSLDHQRAANHSPSTPTRQITVALPREPKRSDDGSSTKLASGFLNCENENHGRDRNSLSPGLQDEDEQTDEAKNALNDIQRMSKHYVELRNWRISFSNTLDKVQSRRTRIQDLRHNQDEADRKFMAAVRAILPTTPQLQQLYKTMQDTRLRCQEAEQHFEDIVDELQHSQEDLKLNERKFYAAIGALETNLAQDKTDRESCSDSSEDLILRGITGDRPEAVHPLYGELRVAFGELQLARELLANTQMKRDSLHSWKAQTLTEDGLDLLETYGDAGKKKALELKSLALMTEEDHAQLEEYDNLEQTARKNIETYTEKVRDLEKKCREKGVLPSSSYFQLEGFGLDPYYRDEIRLAPGPFDCNDESGTLAHPVFPLLLSNPSHLLHEFPHTALQSLRKALQLPPSMPSRTRQINEAAREENIHSLLSTAELDNKGEFINRWLLHKLHQSALEAELLWSTFRARLKILDIDRWQRDVLHFWWRDQPAVDPLPAVVMRGDKSYASTSVACGTVLGSRPVSDSGQLDGLRQWKVEDFWPCMDED